MPDVAALVAAALRRPLNAGERIAAAVSGGADSLALLHLTAMAFPGRVTALTVDHGLRAAAAGEASAVAALCETLNIPHVTLRWTGPKPIAGVQAAARDARYALMGDWCAAAGVGLLLTGHHADDQAETLVMRLARGSGSAGLAGIRAARPLREGVILVRPLLGVRRAALATIVARLGWSRVNDPSNADPRYERSRVRTLLAPHDRKVVNLAAVARHLAEAEAALEWAAARAWAGAATVAGAEITLDVEGLPDELVRRLLVRAIVSLAPAANPKGAALKRLTSQLAAGGSATLCSVKAIGGPVWHFSVAPLRRKIR